MKVQKIVSIGILCALLSFVDDNTVQANNLFSTELCVPMQNGTSQGRAMGVSSISTRGGSFSSGSTSQRISYYGSARTHHAAEHRGTAVVCRTYTPASSLSLGYSSAVPYIQSSSHARRYAPPSSGTGGTIGKSFSNWLEGNGSGAYVYSSNGTKYYNMNTLQELFNAAVASGDMPNATWDEFLQWFNDTNQTQYAAPMGEGMEVLLLCLLGYGVAVAYRKQKR